MTELARTDASTTVTLWISPSVEADYRNRGVFPGLRSDSVDKRAGTWFVFTVPVAFAREVLDDAEARKRELTSGRGVYQAYRSLAEKLRRELDQAEGVLADPGADSWEAEIRSVGCLPLGTDVQDEDGTRLRIVRPYTRYRVNAKNGVFRDRDDGKRFSYQYGYVCKDVAGGGEFFKPAGDLFTPDGDITHLKLVRVDGRCLDC